LITGVLVGAFIFTPLQRAGCPVRLGIGCQSAQDVKTVFNAQVNNTIITTQTKDNENISINNLNNKKKKKRLNKILT
jgi:hypothetical protein